MRIEITEADYDLAIAGDLTEMFEAMIQQRHYLEVIAVNNSPASEHLIVAKLDTFNNTGDFYHAGAYWHRANDGRYAFEHGVEDGAIDRSFFAYDTTADAIAHLNELLAGVTSDI